MGVLLRNFVLFYLLASMGICQDCSYPTSNDLEYVIKQIISPEESPASVDVIRFNVVCLAFGYQKDLYRGVSVVVEYTCSGSSNCPVGVTVFEQIESECEAGFWSTVSSVVDSTVYTHSPASEADFAIPERKNCSFCLCNALAERVSLVTDPVTHCVPCDWTCNRGQGSCFGLAPSVCQDSEISSSSCCNFYLNSTCVHDCPGPYISDASNDCVCPVGTTGLNCEEAINCGCLLNPENGVVMWTDTVYSSIAVYSCNTGHELMGDETRSCSENGDWSGSTPNCAVVDCGHLEDPLYGTISLASTVYNSVVTYSCDTGYTVDGQGERTCLENGLWSGQPPVCSVVDCGPLENIQNGMAHFSETVYGSVGTYACSVGYDLEGSTSRECLPTGEWSGSTPKCSEVNCGILEDQDHGSVEMCDTTYNSVATYFCDIGYTLMGDNIRTCLANGDWSGRQPSCTVTDCGPLQHPDHGTVSALTTTYNSVATYTCDIGYNLFGESDRRCSENGEWSGKIPTCMGNGEESENGDSDECDVEVVGGVLGLLLFISIVINIIAVYVYHPCKKGPPNTVIQVKPAKPTKSTQTPDGLM